MGFLKQLFCTHHFVFLRNVYGDERLLNGGKCSDWKCTKCGKLTYQEDLVHDSK
jgi:hypothetical protein